MSDTAFQLAVYDYAKRKGKDPTKLSDAELLKISIGTKSRKDRMMCGARAVKSLASTTFHLTVVSPEVYDQRKQICLSNKCGYLMEGKSGKVVCGYCGCSGVFMESALKDPNESCRLPEGRKLWQTHGADIT